MKIHPALAPFPELPEPELAALAMDVKANGLVNPVVRAAGMLLDGRARLVACARAKVKPEFSDYTGDPFTFVLRANGGRAMTAGQRQLAAAELYLATKVSPETSQVSGETRVDRAAHVVEGLGVPRATLFRAVKLASAGNRDLVEAVRRGELKVNEALRKLPSAHRDAPKPKAAKKYWREPLVDKITIELERVEKLVRDACEDAIVRQLLEQRIAESTRILFAISDGSAYAEGAHA